uniref:Chondroitin sulfate proteoglycan 4-like n=1 Tax=Mastacembelus armatus TaxID=205130 RepID=A0A3Q3LFQ3_9TELE
MRVQPHELSFYGDGYIHLRTVEASVQTLVNIRFRTSSEAGLLFLATGRRDFLLLELISGCLQVRLDLGSGERSLCSEKGINLNDLAWHSVELTHNHHNVTMTVDRNSHTILHMPGPDVELSIEDGLFVGGAARLNLSHILNISPGFRGCVDEVVFNEHNLLSSLRPYSGYKTVHEVSLGCSPQFSATAEDPVSFFSSKAFIALPTWETAQEGMFECELQPSAREDDGMVLYSSRNQSGFVAITIREGHLVATVGSGEGSKIELRSLTHLQSKNTWCPIQLQLLPHSVQLKVDKELIKANLSAELQIIQLKGPLYLGGLNEHAWGEARRTGLLLASSIGGGSFKGCLREIRVNTQRSGLAQATVTKDITLGCKTGQAPASVTTIRQTDHSEFDVATTQPISNNKRNPNFLLLKKLEVAEGGRAPLELDLSKDRTFSMLDLWQGRVMYVHSGSEDQNDFFMFSVFASNKKDLPVFLKGNRLHRFDISISPVNDAPVLSLPEGNLFTLLENSKQRVGKVEHHVDIYLAINLFSLHDLDEGKISFVHTGVSTSRLALRVSDGQKLSNTVVLRIMAVPLKHKLANNTGLEVNQGEASVITTSHLAVQLNVADHAVEIRYEVIELPQYGELQRLHSSGEWKPTTSFSQKHLQKDRIRYLSTYYGLQTQNVTDQLKCKITIGSFATEEVVFLITVHWLHFKITRSKMELNGVQMAVITPEHLHVISKGAKLSESNLYFRLLTLPKKGRLFFNNKALQNNASFSQKNITDALVKYELVNGMHDDTRDTFSFQVFSTHASSTSYDFRINIKTESSVITIVNKGLAILEGGSKVITKDILFTHTSSNHEVQYSITVSPRHGQIRRINLSNSTFINDNIVTFRNRDIMEERIMYVHDDSETKQDSFTFQIMVYKPPKHNKKKDKNISEHTFNISVQLVNDRRPVRVVDKVFHVARNGQRLVTLNDLCFRDDDSDFEDSWLVYTRRGIPMGELVLADDPNHKLYEFTQRDLEQKKVLFVHKGVSFGRFVLFVSDGKHYVSTLLEVMAHDPYLNVENNTGLVVQRGGITTLTSANLSVSSNLDIRDPEEVKFEVFITPKHGVLCFNDGDRATVTETDAISIFSQQDLVAGRLVYHHDGSHELSDGFNVTARAKEKSTESQLDKGRRAVHLDIGVSIKIFLESHQRPPTVISNHPVVVAEGQNVSIGREHLEVVHEDSQPTDIVFTVQSPPSLGLLQRFFPVDKHRNNSGENQLIYQSQPTLKVSVGPIRLEIDIVPLLLPLQVSNLTLDEGSSMPLTSDIIKVTSHHFSGMNFLYQVEREYISYIHDGSDTQRDNFTIVANQTEITKHSLPCTFHINITPVNDETPVVTTNQGLKVWVGSVTEITTDDLSAEDSDTPPEGLEFIVTPPSNGHLVLKSAPSRHILNFTQSHIQSGQLVFVHSGALSGGFHFQVNDGINFSPRQIFSTTARSLVLSLQRNHPLKVYPGTTTHSATTEHCRHGKCLETRTLCIFLSLLYLEVFQVFLRVRTAVAEECRFYRNKHAVCLCHSGAVVAEGGRVTIDKSKLDASNLLEKVPQLHRKDHHILYRAPFLLSQHYNQKGHIFLQSFNLHVQVEDHDTPPEELHYLVIRKPNNGYLTLGERPEPVTSFTQYDVNHGRLHFIQQVKTLLHIFLEVIKPSVSMVNNTGLSLVQGRTAVVLTTSQLAAQTNGRSQANITYTVTTHPHHGRIAINDQEVTWFCHEDLQFGRVVYHMTDLSESEDSFQISASASSPSVDFGNITAQTVKVTVQPLIYLREPVRVPSGIAVKLGKAMIDASELARISRANPVFEVLSPPKHGKLMTYDPNQPSEVLKSFTFRDVVQGRVAIKETLSDSNSHDNKSTLTTAQGHTPARPLNDSFIFLLKAGNVQPAKGELHFTILPHHQMNHGPGGSNKADGGSHQHTTARLPAHNRTTAGGGRGEVRVGSTTQSQFGTSLHPHILSQKNHNRTQHKLRHHNHWGNHTRSGSHAGRSGTGAEGAGGGDSHTPQLHTPLVPIKHDLVSPPDIHPVHVEVLPQPASDPLLIILPLLACLLLIVILVVLILVFRHRKEKQARLQLIQELAALPLPPEGSPYLGRPERSLAMPSVVVTPLGPASCPTSPRVPLSPRRRSLAPGITFWGPFEAEMTDGDGNTRGDKSHEIGNVTCGNRLPAITTGFKTPVGSRSPTPTLKNNQYWV